MADKKEFSVNYNFTTSYEAVVKAETAEEAIAKVKEVVGDDISIESSWEVKPQAVGS